jgi:hypothetical protein
MDRAHEGDETRECIEKCELDPCFPPKSNHLKPWGYDKITDKHRNGRNEIENLFRRINAFRPVFSQFEKGNVMFTAFGLIMEMIKQC